MNDLFGLIAPSATNPGPLLFFSATETSQFISIRYVRIKGKKIWSVWEVQFDFLLQCGMSEEGLEWAQKDLQDGCGFDER